MRNIGRALWCLFFAGLIHTAQAAVVAGIDRQQVSLGDTLRLTITATEDEEISDTDLRPLLVDFEILQRSTSSSTSIVNGRRTHSKQILLDITPRRQGALEIPPLRVGKGRSNRLSVNVGPPASAGAATDTVLFEAEVDRTSVYVQGQVILTLRIQQAINLDNRGVSELKLDDAFVKQLEQKSYQRSVDGRPWLVHEIRYAIFPAFSGTLEIPAQTFTARESRERRSFFDLNSGGKLLRRTSEPLTIEVLPRPAEFRGQTWLPGRLVSIEESWSTPPEKLRVGESTTRTITIRGEGLQGAQLPPVIFEPVDGLKYYPDQPIISDTEIGSGLLGSRQDSAALVPTRAGTWVIPEIRIPWWDTESARVRYVEIPARTVEVLAADPATAGSTGPLAVTDPAGAAIAVGTPASVADPATWIWQVLAAVSSVGWLLTLFFLWRGRGKPAQVGSVPAGNHNEARAFKQLAAACAADDAVQARKATIDWAAALFSRPSILSLDEVDRTFEDAALHSALAQLNRSLFSKPAMAWDGRELAGIVRRLRAEHVSRKSPGPQRLKLYPA